MPRTASTTCNTGAFSDMIEAPRAASAVLLHEDTHVLNDLVGAALASPRGKTRRVLLVVEPSEVGLARL
eukprot:7205957-Alexandrium_andersonii.AAC.1